MVECGAIWRRSGSEGITVVIPLVDMKISIDSRERVWMLLGEFNHNIDEKGRLIIPAKLREDLGDSFVICNGLEGCLFVYSQEEWNKFVAELESLPRMNKDARIFKRYFFGSASAGSFVKQGRVLVPPSLRKNAHLEKEVVLVGVQDRVEIWDKALWEEKNQISEEDLDAIAERMEAIGIRI